jgi:hypothetical protein
MIDERARDMDTDYNMRGYSDLWAHTHTTPGGLYLRLTHIFLLAISSRTLLCTRMLLFACSFSIHQPLFRDLVFLMWFNVISSYLSVSVPLSTSDELS